MLKATNGTDNIYYTRGFELISRREGDASSFYLYDGGLSVRALTDTTGAITDTLVYDAFGNETEKTGTSANTYGFQGEEQDATGLYYLRARYMDPTSGTFTSMDTYAGSLSDPMSLHKYLFANSNPVMYSDPSGLFSLADIDASMAIDFILNAGYMSGYLYIIDASITDPQLEHHDFTGYLCAIGFGMLFAALNLALSATVAGLLVLAIIDTALGAAGTIKGVIDFINGHKIYGGLEILSSVLLTWFGWRNFTSAVNAAKAVGNNSIANSTKRNESVSDSKGSTNNDSLYHYTNEKGLNGINETKQLNPSLKANNPKDARYGNGQYLSDINPESTTPTKLAKRFINVPNKYKYTRYVEIDVRGLNVVKGREGVYVIPNEKPLDLTGRILRIGQVGNGKG